MTYTYRTAGVVAVSLILSVLSFSAYSANADGSCETGQSESLLCANANGYTIEAVTDAAGNFPVIDQDGNSVFSYLVSGPGVYGQPTKGIRGLSHLDILIPQCDVNGGLNIVAAGPAAEELDVDPSSGFGAEGHTVLKFDKELGKNKIATYSLTVEGVVSAAETAIAIKAGTGLFETVILGPSCENPDITASQQCAGQQVGDATYGSPAQSSYTQTITNSGDVELFDISIEQLNGDMSCVLASVEGATDGREFYVGQPLVALAGPLAAGDSVALAIECEHGSPNLTNVANVSAVTAAGTSVQQQVTTNLAQQCPVDTNPNIAIESYCGTSRLVTSAGGLVVEQCPAVVVTNTGDEAVESILVSNLEIPALAGGLDLGTLNPGDSVNVASVAGGSLCYRPTEPDQLPIDIDQYQPDALTFTSTFTVEGSSVSGEWLVETSSSTCSLNQNCSGGSPH